MCRKNIIHQMHHDVSTPIIIDPVTANPTVYANPLRTKHHQCEISHSNQWLPNTSQPRCGYHSCCIPYVEIEWCDHEEDDMMEPEECEFFSLQHHHTRLEYLGHPAAFFDSCPATWQNLSQMRWERPDWFPWFAHHASERAGWEEMYFRECEKLYTAEQDARMLAAVAWDLECSDVSWGQPIAATAKGNLLRAERVLLEQREVVFLLAEWARQYCADCS
ncbi:Uu.00g131240.m01.CDS01 [Anthostomella pinea]|uniref:Uu.00g131240.m01.CDS01 n=1 Tax=Anthostomella pinea TaxID=933095 RepID=A0AAI8YI53_9PEZI|nr:Uu.00g131240.m01.CDS01 [Anthostomella pinea]